VAVVAEVDNEGALDGLHGDPGPAAVARGLEAADEVLQQQRDGAGVGVAFETQREVRLRALGPRLVARGIGAAGIPQHCSISFVFGNNCLIVD